MNYLISGAILIFLIGAFLLMILIAGTKPCYRITREETEFLFPDDARTRADNYIRTVRTLGHNIYDPKVQKVLMKNIRSLGYSKEIQAKMMDYIIFELERGRISEELHLDNLDE